MPRAGEAPQRRNAETTLTDLSGRCRPSTPASRSTLTSNALSEAAWRTTAAIESSLLIEPPSLIALDRSHRDAGDALAAADPAHALVAGRLDADPGRGRRGEGPLHLRLVGPEPRLLADQRRVDVGDRAADRADSGPQQVDRVGVAPLLVVVRKQRADVAAAGSAEDRVDHGVGEYVGVGVPGEPARVLDLDAAEDQRASVREGVAVAADADHQPTRLPNGASWRRRCSKTHISSTPRSSRKATARS